jgi:hypothetical protein
MSRLNSFISNSNGVRFGPAAAAIRVVAWVLIGLVTIDFLIDLLLAYPSDPRVTNPSPLRSYFEYGRSIEGQLSRMTRLDRSKTAPITLSGWYDPIVIEEFPSEQEKPIVSFYGMSHAVRLGFALARNSDGFVPRIIAAPGATTNWAYGAYLRDRGGRKSRAVVLAFMSQNFPMITSLSPMTWIFDKPMPYTADRFNLEDNQLRVIHPPYSSFDRYVESFNDPEKWSKVQEFFAENDPMYNSFMMRANILDYSSLFRLLRRAYGQRFLRDARKAVLDGSGFRTDSEQIKVARAIVHEFAIQARHDGMIPIIFIVNNLGYSNYMYEVLSPVLHAESIPYLSSHLIISPNDPRGYLPDSHFTDEVDDKLAGALVKLIENSDPSPVKPR